jgi:hypothetical protein
MIIRDLFFESGSTEATKIKKILQRYVIYISDQITMLNFNRKQLGGQMSFKIQQLMITYSSN